jgi:hypothetical protein
MEYSVDDMVDPFPPRTQFSTLRSGYDYPPCFA